MTGFKENLLSFQESEGGHISFGDKKTGGIKGHGKVHLNEKIKVQTVNLVDNLRFNLLSIAQLCDESPNEVTFTTTKCFVRNSANEIILKGK